LQAEHHAGEGAGQADDEQRFETDEIELVENLVDLPGPGEYVVQPLEEKERCASHGFKGGNGALANQGDGVFLFGGFLCFGHSQFKPCFHGGPMATERSLA